MNELKTLIDRRQVQEVLVTRVDRLGRDAQRHRLTDCFGGASAASGSPPSTAASRIEAETPTGRWLASAPASRR